MLDSMWSLIIPGLISTFNVIILKNFFSSLPYELVEAASIDGATDFQVLTRIFLPLSFAIFAPGTITAMSATLSMALSTAAALAAVFLGAAGNPLFFGLAISALCLIPCYLRHR